MQAPRRAYFLAAVALLTALVAAGCGGGSGDKAKALLKRGFSESIPSANVSVDVNVSLQGLPTLSQPIRVHIGGPYRSNGQGKLPSLEWGLNFSGAGQTFSAGLVSTGTQAFVKYQGTYYKVDDRTMATLQQAAASRGTSGSRSLKSFGIDPLGMTNVAMVITAASLPVTVLPLLVLMNDETLLGEHRNGWISNVALAAIALLSIVLLVAAAPLQILGSG